METRRAETPSGGLVHDSRTLGAPVPTNTTSHYGELSSGANRRLYDSRHQGHRPL